MTPRAEIGYWEGGTENFTWERAKQWYCDRMPVRASSEGERSVEQHTLGSGLRPEEYPCTSPANSPQGDDRC